MIYEMAEKCEKEVKKICDDYEVYISSGKTIELDSKNDELNFAKEEITQGIGIRVLKVIKWDLHLLQIWIKLIKLHFRPWKILN